MIYSAASGPSTVKAQSLCTEYMVNSKHEKGVVLPVPAFDCCQHFGQMHWSSSGRGCVGHNTRHIRIFIPFIKRCHRKVRLQNLQTVSHA